MYKKLFMCMLVLLTNVLMLSVANAYGRYDRDNRDNHNRNRHGYHHGYNQQHQTYGCRGKIIYKERHGRKYCINRRGSRQYL